MGNYTLANLDDTSLTEITQKIDNNAVNNITITISNDESDASTSREDVTVTGDNWKTTIIDIFGLVSDPDGFNDFTISIMYFDESNDLITGITTTISITILVDSIPPSIESFTEQSTLLPITDNPGFTFILTFNENISADSFTAEDFTVLPILLSME